MVMLRANRASGWFRFKSLVHYRLPIKNDRGNWLRLIGHSFPTRFVMLNFWFNQRASSKQNK